MGDFHKSSQTLLEEWLWRARRATIAHYESAKRLDARHRSIGGALVFFSAITTALSGRTVLGLSQSYLDLVLIPLSVLTFGIACLHVFLNDASRAGDFRRSAAGYAALKREIELELSLCADETKIDEGRLNKIRTQLDQMGAAAPGIPLKIWKTIDDDQARKRRGELK